MKSGARGQRQQQRRAAKQTDARGDAIGGRATFACRGDGARRIATVARPHKSALSREIAAPGPTPPYHADSRVVRKN